MKLPTMEGVMGMPVEGCVKSEERFFGGRGERSTLFFPKKEDSHHEMPTSL